MNESRSHDQPRTAAQRRAGLPPSESERRTLSHTQLLGLQSSATCFMPCSPSSASSGPGPAI